MLNRLRFFKRLVRDLPRQLRLAYCLFRDPRVPIASKAIFAAGMGAIVTPFIDLPAAIPVIGELDVLALSLVALKLFISTCPPEVVADQEQLIIEQRSRFDEDVRNGERFATAIWERFHKDHEFEAARHVNVESEPAISAGAKTSKDQSGVVA